MTPIKFGTDGWRAIIAKDFTVENVSRVSVAVAAWIQQKKKNPSVVLGHDCRFGGKLFADTVAKVLGANGVKVYLAEGFVSTPMISLGTVKHKADIGIIITASHNPPDYNGYKLKGPYGGPLLPAQVEEIERLIPDTADFNPESVSLEDLKSKKLLEYTDLESLYCKHVEEHFDLDLIRNSKLNFAYDAMYGAGQRVMRKLFPTITHLHCDYNPSFMGQAPEPIHKNLLEFSALIRNAGNIHCGLATDGDADRIGLYDSRGNFVDSHHIILLLIHYLVTQKNLSGKICVAFSVSPKVEKLAKHFGLPFEVVKIGFKYVCEIMLKEDVLLGGEESGGIAIKGHLPERDGIWIGLVVWEYMAKTGKTLEQLIEEVYKITGSFAYERSDLHISETIKQQVLDKCKQDAFTSFGKFGIAKTDKTDGYKYFFENGDWLMIRASGTEPVLRTYAESSSREKAFEILKAGEQTLLGGN